MKSMVLGVIIILVGLSVLLGAVFGINLPVMKILLALFFIYLGVKILIGPMDWKMDAEKRSTDHEAVFSQSRFQYPNSKEAKEYVTVFGSSVFDLSEVPDLIGKKIEAVTVFGDSKIFVKKGTPLRIETNTVFAKSEIPGKNISAMGKFNYQTPGLNDTDPALELKVTSVFGQSQVIEKE